MTMVISVLTATSVVQVSDRRVSRMRNDRTIESYEDTWNKAVVFLNRVTFGYTGNAIASEAFPNERTDQWICRILAPAFTLTEAFAALDKAATVLLASKVARQELAIFGAGWSEDGPGQFAPFLCVISNFLDQQGRHQGFISDSFQEWGYRLGAHNVFLFVGGQQLTRDRKYALLRALTKAARRRTDPWNLVRLVGTEVRRAATSTGSGSTISQNLMAVSVPMPRLGHEREMILLSGPPQTDVPTCCYIPAGTDELKFFMANLAGAGTCMSDGSVVPATT
jgi:hypothetical protein